MTPPKPRAPDTPDRAAIAAALREALMLRNVIYYAAPPGRVIEDAANKLGGELAVIEQGVAALLAALEAADRERERLRMILNTADKLAQDHACTILREHLAAAVGKPGVLRGPAAALDPKEAGDG